MPLLLVLACATPSAVIQPRGPASEPAATPAWDESRDLDGVERLFTGPFRCSLPTGTVAAFHPNGVVRDAASLRGRWQHRARTLTIEADGQETHWAYEPFVVRGSWHLATAHGVLPCMLGHEAEVPPTGAWLRVAPAGGDVEAIGHRLHDLEGVALVTAHPEVPAVDGLVLVHTAARVDEARAVAQGIADRAGQPVALSPVPDDVPLRLEVGP